VTLHARCTCGAEYDLPEQLAGKVAWCAECRSLFNVPAAAPSGEADAEPLPAEAPEEAPAPPGGLEVDALEASGLEVDEAPPAAPRDEPAPPPPSPEPPSEPAPESRPAAPRTTRQDAPQEPARKSPQKASPQPPPAEPEPDAPEAPAEEETPQAPAPADADAEEPVVIEEEYEIVFDEGDAGEKTKPPREAEAASAAAPAGEPGGGLDQAELDADLAETPSAARSAGTSGGKAAAPGRRAASSAGAAAAGAGGSGTGMRTAGTKGTVSRRSRLRQERAARQAAQKDAAAEGGPSRAGRAVPVLGWLLLAAAVAGGLGWLGYVLTRPERVPLVEWVPTESNRWHRPPTIVYDAHLNVPERADAWPAFKLSTGQEWYRDLETYAYVVTDGARLRVVVYAEEENIAALRVGNSPLISNDGVEIFFARNREDPYYQIVLSAGAKAEFLYYETPGSFQASAWPAAKTIRVETDIRRDAVLYSAVVPLQAVGLRDLDDGLYMQLIRNFRGQATESPEAEVLMAAPNLAERPSNHERSVWPHVTLTP
jgi:hypothetical protein